MYTCIHTAVPTYLPHTPLHTYTHTHIAHTPYVHIHMHIHTHHIHTPHTHTHIAHTHRVKIRAQFNVRAVEPRSFQWTIPKALNLSDPTEVEETEFVVIFKVFLKL